MKVVDRTGERHGMLVVIGREGTYRLPDGRAGGATWRCRCDCGVEIVVHTSCLRRGDNKSCGCYRRRHSSEMHRKKIVDYAGAHHRVITSRGRASKHLCVECGDQAQDWSYDHADPEPMSDDKSGYPYSLDPKHYVPRCRPCHKRFDKDPRNPDRLPLRTVRVDGDLWQASLALAKERGERVSQVIRRALREYVA